MKLLLSNATFGQAVMELDSRRELRRGSLVLRKSQDGRLVTWDDEVEGFYRSKPEELKANDWEVWER